MAAAPAVVKGCHRPRLACTSPAAGQSTHCQQGWAWSTRAGRSRTGGRDPERRFGHPLDGL